MQLAARLLFMLVVSVACARTRQTLRFPALFAPVPGICADAAPLIAGSSQRLWGAANAGRSLSMGRVSQRGGLGFGGHEPRGRWMCGMGNGVLHGGLLGRAGVAARCWGLRDGEGARALLDRVRGGGIERTGVRARGAGAFALRAGRQGVDWRTQEVSAGEGVSLTVSTFNMLCPLFKRMPGDAREAARPDLFTARNAKILDVIDELDSDIVCLQVPRLPQPAFAGCSLYPLAWISHRCRWTRVSLSAGVLGAERGVCADVPPAPRGALLVAPARAHRRARRRTCHAPQARNRRQGAPLLKPPPPPSY
jgi:hypothetical protein